jgi:hypothetical protein
MTCKDPDLTHQAQGLLRRILAARDTAPVLDDLDTLAGALPDAPAGSLRHAASHAATGRWPAAGLTLYTPPEEDEEADEEPEFDAATSGTATLMPDQARLKDLPGTVVRLTYLREYHVTDEDALLEQG